MFQEPSQIASIGRALAILDLLSRESRESGVRDRTATNAVPARCRSPDERPVRFPERPRNPPANYYGWMVKLDDLTCTWLGWQSLTVHSG